MVCHNPQYRTGIFTHVEAEDRIVVPVAQDLPDSSLTSVSSWWYKNPQADDYWERAQECKGLMLSFNDSEDVDIKISTKIAAALK